jgi:hypothetical protein
MRRIIAIAGIAGLSLGLAAIPAGAGNNANFVSTPESGPPGTVIHASDHNFSCDSTGAEVHVELIAPDESIVAEADTVVADDSTWDVDITVPADAVVGEYIVEAVCSDGEFRVFYNDNSFTVTAAPATTTTSTTVAAAAVTTTTTTTVPAVVVTPAATPVVASPALTG